MNTYRDDREEAGIKANGVAPPSVLVQDAGSVILSNAKDLNFVHFVHFVHFVRCVNFVIFV